MNTSTSLLILRSIIIGIIGAELITVLRADWTLILHTLISFTK